MHLIEGTQTAVPTSMIHIMRMYLFRNRCKLYKVWNLKRSIGLIKQNSGG